MKEKGVPDAILKKFEEYLQELLDRFYTVHGDSNIQIYFSFGIWGFVNDGNFNEIGSFDELVEWLSSHCEGCTEAFAKD